MKSYNHLFELLISEDNIVKALHKAAVGKKDRKSVQEVLQNPERYIKEKQESIINDTIEFSVQHPIIIREGYQKKTRVIICPDFKKAQWLHHMVVQAMKPIFMKGMYEYTCGSIPKRGVHYGKKHLEKFIKNNPADIKYVLKLDIRHYYPSVDIDLLKDRLRTHIHDERFLNVVFKILDSNKAYIDGEVKELGLPIGYYTSQWFANWYLQPLDHYIKEDLHTKCYVRYMDDMVIFGRNKKELHKKLEKIRAYLKENLHLELKPNYQVFRFDYMKKLKTKDENGNIVYIEKRQGRPIDFMGFKFYRDKTTLRRSIYFKAVRLAMRIKKKANITWFDACQVVSYLGWFYATDTYMAFKKYFEPMVNISACKRIIRKTQEQRRHKNGTKLQKIRKPAGTCGN